MHLKKVIESIEEELSQYYDFHIDNSAVNYLLSRDDLKYFMPLNNEEKVSRAQVIFSQENSETFIGIHFDQSIEKKLQNSDPNIELTNDNLDAFTVVVEEISHFHLILNRIRCEQKLSHLELELQAEIDKILVSGLFLYRLSGDPHIHALKKLIIDRSIVTGNDEQLYLTSSRYAKKFWQDFLATCKSQKNCLTATDFRKFMQVNYEKPLDLKKLYSKPIPIINAA